MPPYSNFNKQALLAAAMTRSKNGDSQSQGARPANELVYVEGVPHIKIQAHNHTHLAFCGVNPAAPEVQVIPHSP